MTKGKGVVNRELRRENEESRINKKGEGQKR
jgi:hypothetical protein